MILGKDFSHATLGQLGNGTGTPVFLALSIIVTENEYAFLYIKWDPLRTSNSLIMALFQY